MKAKRKRYDAQFKAKIGLEAIRGFKTTQQIAKDNQIHPTQVNQWKQILLEDASSLFEGKRPSNYQDSRTTQANHSTECAMRCTKTASQHMNAPG